MINDLVRNASIVLQDIEIFGADGLGNLLRDGLGTSWLAMSLFANPIPGLWGTLRGRPQGPQKHVIKFNQNRKDIDSHLHPLHLPGFSRRLTRTSVRCSSGISVSFAPWNLGMTSCTYCQFDLIFSFINYRSWVAGWSYHRSCDDFTGAPRDTSDAGKRNRIVGNNTHRMAETQRLDIEESEDLFALEELQWRDISCIAQGSTSVNPYFATCRIGHCDRNVWMCRYGGKMVVHTLDDLAEDTGSRWHFVEL